MNSRFLVEYGFSEFGKFICDDVKRRKVKLSSPGVYAFVLNSDFPRLNGVTDILYIGQAGGRKKMGRAIFYRMMDYCKAYASAPQDKRISDSIKRVKTRVRIGTTLKDELLDNNVYLFYKALPADQCQKAEFELLHKFTEEHIELPPLNRSK